MQTDHEGPQGSHTTGHTGADHAVQPGLGTPPVASPAEVTEPELPYAPLGSRVLGALPDLAAGLAFFLAAGGVVASIAGQAGPGFELEGGPALAAISLTVLGWFAYQIGLEAWLGATPGKVVAGIRVRRPGHSRVGLRAALIRNLLRLVDGIGFYLVGAISVLVSKRNQRLGDLAAGTVVVQAPYARWARIVSGAVVAAGLAGGIFLAFGLDRSAVVVADGSGNEGTTFAADTPVIYVTYQFGSAPPAGTTLRFEVINENVEGFPADTEMAQVELVLDGVVDNGQLTWTPPAGGRPPGRYRIEIFVDDQPVEVVHVDVVRS